VEILTHIIQFLVTSALVLTTFGSWISPVSADTWLFGLLGTPDCVEERADTSRWTPNEQIDIKLCPGSRVFFYSEYAPQIWITDSTLRGRVELQNYTMPCEDIFQRERDGLDVMSCWTKATRSIGNSNTEPGRGTLYQFVLAVGDDLELEEFGGRLEISVTTNTTPRVPKAIEYPPENDNITITECASEYRRATNCVMVRFEELGAVYYAPAPPETAEGVPYCFFANSAFITTFSMPDGRTKFQVTERGHVAQAANYRNIFYFLAPGEHAGEGYCEG
jgi:hypothetical protein